MVAEDLKLEPLTVETLRNEKGFQKTAKKQQKEMDTLHKKHQKERLTVQKAQCAAIERLVKGKG